VGVLVTVGVSVTVEVAVILGDGLGVVLGCSVAPVSGIKPIWVPFTIGLVDFSSSPSNINSGDKIRINPKPIKIIPPNMIDTLFQFIFITIDPICDYELLDFHVLGL
jgi:hypothetical protein